VRARLRPWLLDADQIVPRDTQRGGLIVIRGGGGGLGNIFANTDPLVLLVVFASLAAVGWWLWSR
jgi:hypothetical protein